MPAAAGPPPACQQQVHDGARQRCVVSRRDLHVQHVSFWDRRKTGVIYPLDSYNGKVRAGRQSGQDGGRQPATEPDSLGLWS